MRPPAGDSNLIAPTSVGVGFKPQHADDAVSGDHALGFFEVHAENYMGAGGPPHHVLGLLRERFPLSLHGVGLSIGGARPLDRDHLLRLRRLVVRYQPALFSEHLAWSTHDGVFLNDLLPLPYTSETLRVVGAHVDEVQDTLGRQYLVENPSSYVGFSNSTMTEVEFLSELVHRTGCRLLCDVSNIYLSAHNLGFDRDRYVAEFPADAIAELHLGGFTPEPEEGGGEVLIDTHGSRIAEPVWSFYARALERFGPKPTLIEWDNDVPTLDVILAEAARADAVAQSTCASRPRHALAS